MNKPLRTLLLTLITLVAGTLAHAQYKAPSEYFPKNRPIPNAPGVRPSAPSQPPTAPQKAKFKDVTLNSQFYFMADTNRVHAWTKISVTTAKNNKNGITQVINGEIPVQK